MSYLMDMLHGKKSIAQGLAKSATYLRGKTGGVVNDQMVDKAATATTKLAGDLSFVLERYLADHFPALPPVVAHIAAGVAMTVVDSAVAGAANVLKEHAPSGPGEV